MCVVAIGATCNRCRLQPRFGTLYQTGLMPPFPKTPPRRRAHRQYLRVVSSQIHQKSLASDCMAGRDLGGSSRARPYKYVGLYTNLVTGVYTMFAPTSTPQSLQNRPTFGFGLAAVFAGLEGDDSLPSAFLIARS